MYDVRKSYIRIDLLSSIRSGSVDRQKCDVAICVPRILQ